MPSVTLPVFFDIIDLAVFIVQIDLAVAIDYALWNVIYWFFILSLERINTRLGLWLGQDCCGYREVSKCRILGNPLCCLKINLNLKLSYKNGIFLLQLVIWKPNSLVGCHPSCCMSRFGITQYVGRDNSISICYRDMNAFVKIFHLVRNEYHKYSMKMAFSAIIRWIGLAFHYWAICTLGVEYMAIRHNMTVSKFRLKEIFSTADTVQHLIKPPTFLHCWISLGFIFHIAITQNWTHRYIERDVTYMDRKMAELRVILIKHFDGMDNKTWYVAIKIFLEEHLIIGILLCKQEELNM